MQKVTARPALALKSLLINNFKKNSFKQKRLKVASATFFACLFVCLKESTEETGYMFFSF